MRLLLKIRLLIKVKKCGISVAMEVEKCGKRKWMKKWRSLLMLELRLCYLILLKRLKKKFKTKKKNLQNLSKRKRLTIKLSATYVALILLLEFGTNVLSAHCLIYVKYANKMLGITTI